MAFNDSVLGNFYDGLETSAAAIRAMNIEIPRIRLSDAIPDGMTPAKIRKLCGLLPIRSMEINLDEYWGEQKDIFMALNHGKWLNELHIINCRDTINFLPISVK